MPDSLSKTVPVWCCVLNRALFPELTESHDLYVPPNVVSDSERSQMLSRVPGFVDSLRQLNLDLAGLRAQISRPIRPTWVTQETDLGHHYHDSEGDGGGQIFESFRPVICCTSSRRITDGEMSGHSGYVQGAGDDTENWALGLTPPVFWNNAEQLLSTPEADLPGLIGSLVALASSSTQQQSRPTSTTNGTDPDAHALPPSVTQLTPFLHVSPLPLPPALPGRDSGGSPQSWCTITILSAPTPPETWARSTSHMEVGLGARHKAASRALRTALPRICEFAHRFLLPQPQPEHDGTSGPQQQQPHHPKILIADESGGRDLAAGVALALLCWCFSDDDGRRVRGGADPPDPEQPSSSRAETQPPVFTKDLVRARLGRIMTAMPEANPNRATLQSVNSFLMDWK